MAKVIIPALQSLLSYKKPCLKHSIQSQPLCFKYESRQLGKMKLLFGKIYLRGIPGRFACVTPREKNPSSPQVSGHGLMGCFSSSFGAKFLCSPAIDCAAAHCVVSCVATTCVHTVSWDKELLLV